VKDRKQRRNKESKKEKIGYKEKTEKAVCDVKFQNK
jgi:hypothetical protein